MVTIKLGSNQPTLTELIEVLIDYQYERVELITTPGEIAVRGCLIDIFPVNQTHPIRIEYDDNLVERIASFNIQSQRSINTLKTTTIQKRDEALDSQYSMQWADSKNGAQLSVELEQNDYVVHEDFGIGLYIGLKRMKVGSIEGEYAEIQYQGADKIYVPIDKMNRINRYQFGEITPKLNTLKDGNWQKTTKNCKKATEILAKDIYLMMKLRNEIKGISYDEDNVWQLDLERSFKFKPTADQLKAVDDIKSDMESEKVMDRLICGEVGYGKTEVLVRAAFKAINNNKQVAVVVPTTILANQHQHVFQERFKPFNVNVEILSRFQTPKEKSQTIDRMKNGHCKIVVGTHRLFQKDIKFKDLGLIIIDEEQRFGVRQKEKLKNIRENVDVISVSATPIPRTLYLALSGAKSMSRIVTPPVDKKPIATLVTEYNNNAIEEAVNREVERSGQIFYLIQRVSEMNRKVKELQLAFPSYEVGGVHGQMKENSLMDTMGRFVKKKIDILVCTTIIENGIDIPNANTIIVEEIENLGLSQLHQIKGRVGRGDKQAYALLLYSKNKNNSKAKKRIEAIKSLTGLGVGYELAMRDLEIRGAGALLGEKQHGHISAVGFELYCKLLSDSVNQLNKNDDENRSKPLHFEGLKQSFIPKNYISSDSQRLAVYKRLIETKNKEELKALNAELKDRFGPLPNQVVGLIHHIQIQLDSW